MSETPQTDHQEERYPLLFLFLEDGNKSAKKGRTVFFERTRSQGIITGATNVFTQFPGYISSCGLSTIIFVLTLIFLFLMILACSVKPGERYLHPNCVKISFDDDQNVKLYLVHNGARWEKEQLEILEEILTKYNRSSVELIDFVDEHEVEKYNDSRSRPKRFAKERTEDMNINIGAKNILRIFGEKTKKYSKIFGTRKNESNPFVSSTVKTTTEGVKPLEGILKMYPKLTLTRTTKPEFFEFTPLHDSWKKMNQATLNFAARILRLWDNAGISFKLPDIVDNGPFDFIRKNLNYYKYTIHDDNLKIIETMIATGYDAFKNLPEGLVTVDEEGIHMETKTTCHAFFGEALNQLKHANENSEVKKIIQDTLKTFCVKGAVDSEYCNSVKSMSM